MRGGRPTTERSAQQPLAQRREGVERGTEVEAPRPRLPRLAERGPHCRVGGKRHDRGGLREVAGDAAIYVPADDPAALSAAIRALATNPARRAALEQAGRERARLFDAPVIAARLAALRREVLAAAGG